MSPVAPGDAIVLASSNPGKLREMRAILAGWSLTLWGLDAFDSVVLPEEGDDYLTNAAAKALGAARQTGCLALADDSGLEVAGLAGAPGPRSARYGGPGLDDAGRLHALLEATRDLRGDARRARFVCFAALATPAGSVVTARGECDGRILETPCGSRGFGYDPIFQVAGRDAAMAELPDSEKNRISHRARAILQLAQKPIEGQNWATRS